MGSWCNLARTGLTCVILSAGCGTESFDPPVAPAHTNSKDGVRHAPRLRTPFLCGDAKDPSSAQGVPCPNQRPTDERLSCDAQGCHGNFDFSGSSDSSQRNLEGSDGPSCYGCHGRKWNDS